MILRTDKNDSGRIRSISSDIIAIANFVRKVALGRSGSLEFWGLTTLCLFIDLNISQNTKTTTTSKKIYPLEKMNEVTYTV